MKNKILIICVISVLCIAVTSVYAFGLLNNNNDNQTVTDNQENTLKLDIDPTKNMSKDSNAETEKTVPFGTSGSNSDDIATLKYSYSKNFGDIGEADVYIDNNSNEYVFDKQGNLFAYFADSTTVNLDTDKNTSDSKLTEHDIVDIAVSFAKKIFGDKFSGYELRSVDLQDVSGRYYLSFSKKYGDCDFVTGEVCNVITESDGKVVSCSLPNAVTLEGFDGALLSGITLESVTEFAEAEAAKLFTDLISFNVSGITIRKIDGSFVIEISCHHTTESSPSKEIINKYNINMALSDTEISFKMSYYYPLES